MTTETITYTIEQNGIRRVHQKQVPLATDLSRCRVTVNPKRPPTRPEFAKMILDDLERNGR